MRFAQSVENSGLKDCRHTYEGVYIAERDEEILRLVMDLRVLNNILSRLPEKRPIGHIVKANKKPGRAVDAARLCIL